MRTAGGWRAMLVGVALLAGAARAEATQPGWPALHDVAGVAADDVLNLRAGPGPGFDVVGALVPGARGVEVVAPSDDGGWGLVNHGDGTAWASLAFLRRRPGQWLGASPRVARCFGTEPFWAIEVRGDAATRIAPGAAPAAGTVLARPASASDRRRHGLVMALGGVIAVASLRQEACSDGMSDRRYGLAIDVVGAEVLSGCCSLAP